MEQQFEQTTLAGGCFWCLEAVFQRVRGVHDVVSGYTGGHTDAPDYRQVCAGQTGHAEAVQLRYDPAVIDFDTLLDIFFTIHDPTTPNRQGNDVGTQYRSAIFWHTPGQQASAQAKAARVSEELGMPVVTQIVPAGIFHTAESEHQDYYNRHPNQPYCMAVAAPKVAKLKRHFAQQVQA
ncbi:peptide-methionine (S)-S-oxide reductase MsrA [Chitiniphilus purpureus]|uniref:Peptide methionine sulfoxide reductase MsrA n=1 Tax=Chitiniphilus purpureus TaxID=2981137 RepID=A0ABY6DMK6_9NEIS|nr:peptide-methionine (S)-S-oxide reductase MsrA [Chitiniphilus sp. CD1]UXY14331.1 peptide-methionine (S)-S-oxide reductase MsrA [Chitiniphilus sp. CD1]